MGGDRLVRGLAAAIVGPGPERAMLAAYSLGELARPLPGVELALGGAARAERAARGAEDRPNQSDENEDENENARFDDAFVGALPFLANASGRPPTFLVAPGFEDHPVIASRRARAEALAASALGAASAARGVLADGEAHVRDWVARGDAALDGAVSHDKAYGYARDHSAQNALRALPLPVKRKWLLEMLRWELGPVSAGVPLPGAASVALAVDRAKVLRDLCKHCELPDDLAGRGAFSSAEFQDTDSSGDEEREEREEEEEEPQTPPSPRARGGRGARGAFSSPPRGGVSVRFVNERGEGAALRREWFALVAEKAADHTHGLFVSHDGGRSLHPHACSGAINPKTHLKYFAALGRVAAVALYHGETLPLRLTDAFFARAVLGARASLEDLRSVDPTLYANKIQYLSGLLRASSATTSNATSRADADATLRALDLEWSDAADPTGVFFPGEMRPFSFLPPFPIIGNGGDANDDENTHTRGKSGEKCDGAQNFGTSGTASARPAVTSETLGAYLRAFAAHRT